jgi:septal ring factor EnvC (AmiA/AmiB activator)
VVVELRDQAIQVPGQLSTLSQSDAAVLQKQIDDLKAQNAGIVVVSPCLDCSCFLMCLTSAWCLSTAARRYSDIEERLARSQAELDQVTGFLDGARAMNTSLQSKLDMEKKSHEVTRRELQVAYSMLSAYYQEYSHPQDEIRKLKEENQALTSRDNLEGLYKHATSSLSSLERSHKFTMKELQSKRDELKESQDEVLALDNSLSSRDSIIKDLRVSKKLLSQELDPAKHNIGVLEDDREILKASYDKAMDKAIRAGRLLMKRPDVVVREDILSDVLSASRTAAKTPTPNDPKTDPAPKDTHT